MSAIERTRTFRTARRSWEATMPAKTVTTSGTPGRTFSTTRASLSDTWSSLEMTTTASTSSSSALRMARSCGSRR